MEKMNKVTLKQGSVIMTVAKFEKGYLATINHIDADGDVEFGSSGEFTEKAIDAVRNAIDYYRRGWQEPNYSLFNTFK